MQLETKRLILRELDSSDFDALYEILSDIETMKHYPKPFCQLSSKKWGYNLPFSFYLFES